MEHQIMILTIGDVDAINTYVQTLSEIAPPTTQPPPYVNENDNEDTHSNHADCYYYKGKMVHHLTEILAPDSEKLDANIVDHYNDMKTLPGVHNYDKYFIRRESQSLILVYSLPMLVGQDDNNDAVETAINTLCELLGTYTRLYVVVCLNVPLTKSITDVTNIKDIIDKTYNENRVLMKLMKEIVLSANSIMFYYDCVNKTDVNMTRSLYINKYEYCMSYQRRIRKLFKTSDVNDMDNHDYTRGSPIRRVYICYDHNNFKAVERSLDNMIIDCKNYKWHTEKQLLEDKFIPTKSSWLHQSRLLDIMYIMSPKLKDAHEAIRQQQKSDNTTGKTVARGVLTGLIVNLLT